MANHSSLPRKTGKVRLVLELETPLDNPGTWMRITGSIPGRDSHIHRVWELKQGLLLADDWVDMCAWIENSVLLAIQTTHSVQVGLPLGG